MVATTRQKACIPCAESKRRCDRQQPECQRCLDRDVDCAYPQPRKRRRLLGSGGGSNEGEDANANEASASPDLGDYDAMHSNIDFESWSNALGSQDGFIVPLSDTTMMPYMVSLPAAAPTYAQPQQDDMHDSGIASDDSSEAECPWFLKTDTWALQQGSEEPECVSAAELEPFIQAVDEMLQFWVKNGHNTFIHKRLYDNGMPFHLQDAFTTFAAYTNRTPAVAETILQIAEQRAQVLAQQGIPATNNGPEGILAHLSRVQALFIFIFTRLFDNSVRMRSSAEKQLPTLKQWVLQMWQSAKRYKGPGTSARSPLKWTTSELDNEYTAVSETWKLWALIESVRRTHVIVDTVLNIYQIMTRGWAECTGAVNFTARRGLWGADSAMKWFQECCAKEPLLVPSLGPSQVMEGHGADEIDEFASLFWTFIVGTDRIQCWIDRGQ